MANKKGSPETKQRLRMAAANMFELKKTSAEIARCLEVDDQTVRRWRRLYKTGGRKALESRTSPGRPRKLSDPQRRELLGFLAQEPKACGYDKHLWTLPLVARLVLDKFGVEHHHDHLGVILHQLGLSPQIPARRAMERDEKRITQWREETWPALQKK